MKPFGRALIVVGAIVIVFLSIVVGMVLVALGFILQALPSDEVGTGERRCPHCKAVIRSDATKCKHCASDVTERPGATERFDGQWQCKCGSLNDSEIAKCACGRVPGAIY